MEKTGKLFDKKQTDGLLRPVIYGFNDGLTANFGLIMGVIGSSAHPQVILLAGIAGLIADTLSMGSSSYLAAASEKEVYDNQIAREKKEIEDSPHQEEAELSHIYEQKGFTPTSARVIAAEVMKQEPQ